MNLKNMLGLALALLGLFAGRPANGQPALKGPAEVEYPSLARFSLDNAPPKAKIVWRVFPSAGVDRADTFPHKLQFLASPGTYQVEASVHWIASGEIEVLAITATVKVVSPPAPTPPAPTPPAPTPPAPTPPAPTPPAPANPLQAIGRIGFSGAWCTAAPIEPQRADGRYYLCTAAHCVSSVGQEGVYYAKSGTNYRVRVVALNQSLDAAILVTVNPQPAGLPTLKLASRSPAVGTRIWHAGYGVDRPANVETGTVVGLPTSNNRSLLECILNVSSGDSGGPLIVEGTRELVGVVCCTQRKGAKVRMYAGSVESLRRLLGQVDESVVSAEVQANGFEDPDRPVEMPLLIPAEE